MFLPPAPEGGGGGGGTPVPGSFPGHLSQVLSWGYPSPGWWGGGFHSQVLSWGWGHPSPGWGVRDAPPPSGSKFFHFHAVFRNFWLNNRLVPPSCGLAPPPLGNPGSTTALKSFEKSIKHRKTHLFSFCGPWSAPFGFTKKIYGNNFKNWRLR